jgi:hypothetical protein
MVKQMMNMLMTWAYGQKLLALYNLKFQKFSAMKLYSNALFMRRLSEFMKVVVILAMVQITMLVNG